LRTSSVTLPFFAAGSVVQELTHARTMEQANKIIGDLEGIVLNAFMPFSF